MGTGDFAILQDETAADDLGAGGYDHIIAENDTAFGGEIAAGIDDEVASAADIFRAGKGDAGSDTGELFAGTAKECAVVTLAEKGFEFAEGAGDFATEQNQLPQAVAG